MKRPLCARSPKTSMHIGGWVGDYLAAVTEQWLLVAPKANPAMLEMFRDRDAAPLRHMLPWAGEFAGKYLVGAVQVLRVTGDPQLKAWLKEYVERLVSFQDDDGYLGPWPRKYRLTNTAPNSWVANETWDTWGHYQIMLGLLLWHEDTCDKAALTCATRIGDLLCRKYLGTKKPRLVDTPSTETNLGIVHGLCILHRVTGTQRYLDLALQIVDEFGATSKGTHLAGDYLEQALRGVEFYEMPNQRWESLHSIMAFAELHWITGESQYRRAFEHIWWSIVKHDRHNNGGFSSGEKATGNPYDLAAIETCCTVAWMALCVEMLKLTGNSLVADELELSMLNFVIGSHSATGCWVTYNTPMDGVRRASNQQIVFQAREGSPELNCCSVNAPRGFGLLSDWALLKDRDGLILNHYGPSTFEVQFKPGVKVTIAQKTEYPADGGVTVRLQVSKATRFTLKLRIPQWSSKTNVKVNGEAIRGVVPGQYLPLERMWKSGDTVELRLDMSLHFWRGERECKGRTSVYRGPILLAFDQRHNLEHARTTRPKVRTSNEWDPVPIRPVMPTIDAHTLRLRRVKWHDWLPPLLLFKCKAADGTVIHLCDFGSAGETGSPYASWLPITHSPTTRNSSREHPLPTRRRDW